MDHYVGKQYGMRMRLLVKTSINQAPSSPPNPTKEKQSNPIKMKLWERKVDSHDKQLNVHNLNKEKVFIILLGQCNTSLLKQVESKSNYGSLETSADAPGLLKIIKSIVHNNKGTQYNYWALSFAMRKITTVRQFKNEESTVYYNCFVDFVDVAESQWGPLVLCRTITTFNNDGKPVVSSNKDEAKHACEKYLACVFLSSALHNKYGKCTAELNNSFLWKWQVPKESRLSFGVSRWVHDRRDNFKEYYCPQEGCWSCWWICSVQRVSLLVLFCANVTTVLRNISNIEGVCWSENRQTVDKAVQGSLFRIWLAWECKINSCLFS